MPRSVTRCGERAPTSSSWDAEYDTGAVVRQDRVRVLPGDTVESLKSRVQACERQVVVKTLAAMASGELAFG
jgi:phosphoribosylglycinamide formyltransferase-1